MNGANGVGNSGVLSKIDAERQAQRSYWTEHSVETTVEAMMLDSQAKAIDLEERPEVSMSSLCVFDQPLLLCVVANRVCKLAPPNTCCTEIAWRLALRMASNRGPCSVAGARDVRISEGKASDGAGGWHWAVYWRFGSSRKIGVGP